MSSESDIRKIFEIAVAELQYRKFTFLTEDQMHDIYDNLCRHFKRSKIYYERTKPGGAYKLDLTASI